MSSFISTAAIRFPRAPFKRSASRDRPSPPLRRVASTTRALLTNEPEQKRLQPPGELPAEQLNAYFATEDTASNPALNGAIRLALRNFFVELTELRISISRIAGILPPQMYTPPDCLGLTLDDDAVNKRERERELKKDAVKTSWFVDLIYYSTCRFLDFMYEKRPIPRFWVLETVARMPYFAYTSCLHLYATLGWHRSPALMNMHHAEELNEAFHLAVMESLGGDKQWLDRFLASHTSLIYYWVLVVLFLISPGESYRFSQRLEAHAVDTYAQFIVENESRLRKLPVPDVAHEYFENYLYYFEEFQLVSEDGSRSPTARQRPQLTCLYDVFENIVEDEKEHLRTMNACSDYVEKECAFYYNGSNVKGSARKARVIPEEKREKFWREWETLNVEMEKEKKKISGKEE